VSALSVRDDALLFIDFRIEFSVADSSKVILNNAASNIHPYLNFIKALMRDVNVSVKSRKSRF
jgi:hypothetical protein